jgi:hypothetical protein
MVSSRTTSIRSRDGLNQQRGVEHGPKFEMKSAGEDRQHEEEKLNPRSLTGSFHCGRGLVEVVG